VKEASHQGRSLHTGWSVVTSRRPGWSSCQVAAWFPSPQPRPQPQACAGCARSGSSTPSEAGNQINVSNITHSSFRIVPNYIQILQKKYGKYIFLQWLWSITIIVQVMMNIPMDRMRPCLGDLKVIANSTSDCKNGSI